MSDELSQKLSYVFQQPHLLKLALTHRSKGGEHNERLEFLGDAIVNFVIAELLYHQFPMATEGELSRWRASLVNRDSLAELAREFDLGQYLVLGHGELRSGGHERHSILSCTMEAVIGAIYLDGGFDAACASIKLWYQPFLRQLSSAASHKDSKTLLQEYLQRHRMPLPIYSIEEIHGQAHQQQFTIRCEIEGAAQKTHGKGTSRRRAEQAAALAMLKLIKK